MVVFGLVGFGLIKAAIDYNPRSAIGLDGALNKLVHNSYGPVLLGAVAAGLIGFAMYSIADARRWTRESASRRTCFVAEGGVSAELSGRVLSVGCERAVGAGKRAPGPAGSGGRIPLPAPPGPAHACSVPLAGRSRSARATPHTASCTHLAFDNAIIAA